MSKGYEQTRPLARKEFSGAPVLPSCSYRVKDTRVYYVQFMDPVTGKRLSAISTGKNNRDDALIVVAGWLKEGVLQRQAKQESRSHRPVEALLNVNQRGVLRLLILRVFSLQQSAISAFAG
jgi:hypothetical protein